MNKNDGMNYAPVSRKATEKVVEDGTFQYAAVGLAHGHIYAMCNGLNEVGANLKWVYEKDPELLRAFLQRWPKTLVAESEEQIFADDTVQLIVSADIPSLRTSLGLRSIRSGKHFFADKPTMTSFAQLEEAKQATAETGKKFYVYFGERIHVESAVYAQQLIEEGAIGRVLQLVIMAPHRLSPNTRPDWFWEPDQSGAILTDLGSHQFEQFLTFTGAKTGSVQFSRTANYANHDHPEFRDFGDALLLADNGATAYCRVDWFTPDGMGAWGDGRVFVMGEKGSIEIRKYLDVAASNEGDQVILVDKTGEQRFSVHGRVGFPFFGQFVLDCINNTENSMSQEHVFEAMRLALEASQKAVNIT